MAGLRVNLQLRLPNDWDNVERGRRLIRHVVVDGFDDPDLADALAMVGSELLENAFRYGEENASVRLLVQAQDDDSIVVAVTSTVAAGSPHLETLRARVERLGALDDPEEVLRVALADRAKASAEHGGLGLARVIYEGRCRLECDLSQPGKVTVRARRLRS
jgi:anti-sigma regulatory factor (Ser/Thr protein kinase)